MRKFLLLAAVALLGMTAANAQVKLGFGVGYALPTGDIADYTDGGVSAHLELGYGVTEDIDVSILAQGDFLVGGDETINGQNVSFGAIALSSYLLNGRYYFRKEGFRPYGSLGLGITSIGSVEVEATGNTGDVEVAASTSNFAIRPAIGFKYGVLNMNVAYLNAGKTGEGNFEQSVSDFTINLGLLFTFGGN
ncbi:outer membrane beta-barrel protein [Aquimarina algiphila]|uniref:outer membrane beta-barrel protein n=1 Tax=Aquimarina algiphila TaxID=2047982 RepID=UPI00232D7F0E|nr:outer membrane beta-barrel protein [Aquimarina algiphila]